LVFLGEEVDPGDQAEANAVAQAEDALIMMGFTHEDYILFRVGVKFTAVL
jgi:hypothetical protein